LIDATRGVVKIVFAAKDGRVVGGGAFGEHAADILTPVALAIAKGLVLEDMAELFPAYPSLSELTFVAARGYAC
jgi:dihydrolipoamide dehydrogenase